MKRLSDLEAMRVSAKLRFEACWRTGDMEGEALAMCELEQIDRELKRELRRIETQDE